MQEETSKEFGLEEILSLVIGINLTIDPQKVLNLIGFIVDKEPTEDVREYYFEAEEHVLKLHPELNDINMEIKDGLPEWLDEQKKIYGSKLTITKMSRQL